MKLSIAWGFTRSFGSVRSGLMGDGGTGFAPALTPVPVSGIGTAVAIAAAREHSCALLADGAVWCWGRAAYARGQSDITDVALAPVQVAMSGAVNAMALGDRFTCVSLVGAGVQCLGVGSQGQLGTGGQVSFRPNLDPSPYPGFSITPVNVVFP
jgi:hypothetical protein